MDFQADNDEEEGFQFPEIKLLSIKGRTYRQYIISRPGGRELFGHVPQAKYVDEGNYSDEDYADMEIPDDVEKKGDFFHCSLDVPQAFYGFIYGKRKSQLSEIEEDTKTEVRMPDRRSPSTIIRIKGRNPRGVSDAKERILLIVASSRVKVDYTHFISIPLNSDRLQTRYRALKEQMLKASAGNRGIHPSIFVRPATLHLTCFCLKLLSPDELGRCKELLSQIGSSFQLKTTRGKGEDSKGGKRSGSKAEQPHIKLTLQGLEIMNDDVQEVDVLYLRVLQDEGLALIKEVMEHVIAEFLKAKLISVDEVDKQHLLGINMEGEKFVNIKFHATLMNTKHRRSESKNGSRKRNSGKGNRRFRQRETFDATSILENFSDVSFGSEVLDRIELSSMQWDRRTDFYRCDFALPL